MEPITVQQVVFSIVAFLTVFLIVQVLTAYAKKVREKHRIHKSRYFAIKRLINILSLMVLVLVLVLIWGINLKDLWGSVTGIIAMVAVAFFAAWSLIGNILAGIIIFFTSPFKINDTIEIMPDEISGKVQAINTFYTLLADKDGNYINIPNSLFFQRYIKNIKHS